MHEIFVLKFSSFISKTYVVMRPVFVVNGNECMMTIAQVGWVYGYDFMPYYGVLWYEVLFLALLHVVSLATFMIVNMSSVHTCIIHCLGSGLYLLGHAKLSSLSYNLGLTLQIC